VPSGTITWIDRARGCCFISTGVRSRDVYADGLELDSRSPVLRVGAAVEFAVLRGMRGRVSVTDVVAKESGAAVAFREGEGGALR